MEISTGLMAKSDRLLDKYIDENQLRSCMNNTKWKELVEEIPKIQDFNPSVNINTVFEKDYVNVRIPHKKRKLQELNDEQKKKIKELVEKG